MTAQPPRTFGLRVTRGPYTGDIITLGEDRTEASAWECRKGFLEWPTEVVELDEHGNPVPTCRHTCSCTSDMECPHDCTCEDA